METWNLKYSAKRKRNDLLQPMFLKGTTPLQGRCPNKQKKHYVQKYKTNNKPQQSNKTIPPTVSNPYVLKVLYLKNHGSIPASHLLQVELGLLHFFQASEKDSTATHLLKGNIYSKKVKQKHLGNPGTALRQPIRLWVKNTRYSKKNKKVM